jgi:hypothetical protein
MVSQDIFLTTGNYSMIKQGWTFSLVARIIIRELNS